MALWFGRLEEFEDVFVVIDTNLIHGATGDMKVISVRNSMMAVDCNPIGV